MAYFYFMRSSESPSGLGTLAEPFHIAFGNTGIAQYVAIRDGIIAIYHSMGLDSPYFIILGESFEGGEEGVGEDGPLPGGGGDGGGGSGGDGGGGEGGMDGMNPVDVVDPDIFEPNAPRRRTIPPNFYQKISEIMSFALDAMSQRDVELLGAVTTIVGIEDDDGEIKMDLLKDFNITRVFHEQQGETTIVPSVRKINQHILNRTDFNSIDDYLEFFGLAVYQEWKNLSDAVGFTIDESFVRTDEAS